MPTFDKLGEIDWTILLAVILPGFVSIHVHRMIRPGEQVPLKDLLADSLFFGLLNAAIVGYPLTSLAEMGPRAAYSALALGVFIAPAFWPFLVARVRSLLVERGILLSPQHTSWDDFFLRREPCWLVVAMKDGSLLGGYFGKKSHASLFPRSGHLYIEEVWQIDQVTGEFVGAIPASKGIILRPEDYSYVTIREV